VSRSWGSVLLFSAAAAVAAPGCAANPAAQLSVDLKTDYAPEIEFTEVRADLFQGRLIPADDESGTRVLYTPRREHDFLAGRRVAEFAGVPTGPYALRLRLVTPSGFIVAERTTTLDLSRDVTVTLIVSRSCRDVSCPRAGDDLSHTACVGGRCVSPSCTVEDPAECGTPECTAASECVTSVPCARSACIDGVCLYAGDHTMCGSREYCDTARGCVPLPGDAGCIADGRACDDGLYCNGTDTCSSGTCNAHSGDPCAGAACDETTRTCRTDPCATGDGGPCDDGVFCNGADSCAGGACGSHSGSPCSGGAVCTESTRTCAGCMARAEECNGLDDDCNGAIDNGVTRACSTGCGSGVETCTAGAWGGCTAPGGSAEICDGLDNDCNGATDEIDCRHAVVCTVFNDGYLDISGESDAIYVPGAASACIPGGATGICGRWWGRCRALPAADGHTHSVWFTVFADGYAAITGGADAIYFSGPESACVPGGPTGDCRRWFGRGYTSTEQGHSHMVRCYAFDDGYLNATGPSDAIFWNGSQLCVPGGAAGDCRRWFGRCETF